MLTPNDLSNVIRPKVADGLYQMDNEVWRAMRALGVSHQTLARGICHPTSYIDGGVNRVEVVGRSGIIVCPVVEPILRVLLWIRDDPREPPLWLQIVDVSK